MHRWRVGFVALPVLFGCSEITQPAIEDSTQLGLTAARADAYEATPLAWGAWDFATPTAINDAGAIVGYVRVGGSTQAVLWARGNLDLLPDLGGGSSAAEDVNGSGEVAGWALDGDGNMRAVVWRRGEPVDLGTLGGDFSFALGINQRGEVVGGAETATGEVNAFLWTKGQMIDLGRLPGSTFAQAEDLNERGEIVGWSVVATQRATLWHRGEILALPSLGYESAALAINARGQIVGGSFPLFQTAARAVLWERGQVRDLGSLADDFSTAHDINNRGQVVGTTAAPGCFQCPFLWDSGVMVLLAEEPFGSARALNDAGIIVGQHGGPVVWSRGTPGWLARATVGRNAQPSAARAPHRTIARGAWADAICENRSRVPTGSAALQIVAGCVP